MDDNIRIITGPGWLRAILKGFVKVPVVAIDLGGSGAESLLSASNPLPIGSSSLSNLDANLGAQADAPASNDSGAASLVALVKLGLTRLATLTKLDLALTALRDAILGSPAKTLFDIWTMLNNIWAGQGGARTYWSGPIALSGSGTIAPAVAGKVFYCTFIQYSVTVAATTFLKSGTTSLEGAGKGWALGGGPDRWVSSGWLYQTGIGEAFGLNLSLGGASGSAAGFYA